ncbi:TPR-like protein [Xylariaceae sp. FL0255]|nr:TPR-like protein [Xylariaceae sp. FL0255]
MTYSSEWSISLPHTRLSIGPRLFKTDATPKRSSFLHFLATVQALGVTFLPITWEAARQDVGAGGTSRIHESLANLRTSFAFKRIHEACKEGKPEREVFQVLVNEITILSHAAIREHANTAELQGICWDISPDDGIPWPVLVFEKSQLGDLYHFASLEVGREMSIKARIRLCVDIGRAIRDMHSSNIIHGDIKPENVLIFKESGRYRAKVIDFGYSSRYKTDDCWLRLPISRPWNAPEHDRPVRLWHPSEAVKADIFSFGMLCFWLIFEPHLSNSVLPDQRLDSAAATYSRLSKDTLYEMKDRIGSHAKGFVKSAKGLDDNRCIALGDFFDSTLSIDPQKRQTDLSILLKKLDSRRATRARNLNLEIESLPDAITFRIEQSIHDLYYCDYRVRSYIAEKLLEEYHHDPALALQLAFCYHIGFGVACDEDKVSTILSENNFNMQQIHNMMSRCVWRLQKDRPVTLGRLWEEGHLKRSDYRYAYLGQAKLEEAEDRVLEETETLVRIFGRDHQLVQISFIMVSGIYWIRGQWSEVERLESEIVEVSAKLEGPDDQTTINHMGNVVSAYWNQGRLDEAERLYLQVIELGKQALGVDHTITLTSMANLASTYWNQSRLEEAEQLFKLVMEARNKVLGAEHPDTLTCMGNLASTYRNQGRLHDAERLFQQVIERKRKILGPEHPDFITSQANLALIYGEQGRLNAAKELLAQIVQTREIVLGAEHPSTMTSKANLATIYWGQGLWGEAEKLSRQVIDIRTKNLGLEHPDTLTSMGTLAAAYRSQGQWDDAEMLEKQVMEMNSKLLGPNHPDTLTSMAGLASTYWEQDRWEEAERLLTQIAPTMSTALGSEHPHTLTTLCNLAATYAKQGKWSEAGRQFAQIIEIQKRVSGESHPSTLTTMANLAAIYGTECRWIEAVQLSL